MTLRKYTDIKQWLIYIREQIILMTYYLRASARPTEKAREKRMCIRP